MGLIQLITSYQIEEVDSAHVMVMAKMKLKKNIIKEIRINRCWEQTEDLNKNEKKSKYEVISV